MSILDFLISIIVWFLDNTVGKLPTEFSDLSLNDFSNTITNGLDSFASSFNFVEMFIPLNTLFILLGVVIVAEILLHFGFKGIKYILNLIRGSGA